jgi:hypothetical protein
MQHGYSDKKLEIINMPVTQRCNYAGSLGKSLPTRSFALTLALSLAARLRGAFARQQNMQ